MALIYKAPKEDKKRKTSSIKPAVQKEPGTKDASSPKPKPIGKKGKFKKKPYHNNIVREIRPGIGLQLEPKGVKFANKDKDENVLVVLRRHPITNFSWIALTVIMFFTLFFSSHFHWLDSLPVSLQLFSSYAWLVLTLLVAWSGFLSWYFNVNIISDKRIVDIDLHDLIYREVSDANLEKIEDVTHNMGGLFGLIFNFGDIYIQTAGTKPQIEFLKVPRPAEVANILRKLREAVTD